MNDHYGRPSRRLWRSSSNKVIAGVLGGLAERLGLATLPLRILFVMFTIGTGGLLAILYIVLWTITQEAEGEPHAPGRIPRSSTSRVLTGVLGGIAERAGFDPTLARILFVIVSVLSAAFPGILVYLVLWTLSGPSGND